MICYYISKNLMNIKKPAKSGLFPDLSAKFYVISERRITKNAPLVN